MVSAYTKRQLQIIHTAVDLISAGGMSSLTMSNIASKIEVTEPALYRHFKSKKEIMLGILNLIRQNGQAPEKPNKTGWDLVECTMFNHIASFTDTPGLAAIIFSEEIFSGDNDLSQQIKALMDETQKRFVTVIRMSQQMGKMRQDIQAEQIALLVIGSFRFLVTQWHLFEHNFDLSERATALFKDFRRLFIIE
ncbi:MAG: TetR/AcrR family transcriptional regulator [Candidatus Marinimicrobia bacterium]|nr:TetR/AcrR family transcriptional regulator [Candidatus Neomarinimicrobiota bacterium]